MSRVDQAGMVQRFGSTCPKRRSLKRTPPNRGQAKPVRPASQGMILTVCAEASSSSMPSGRPIPWRTTGVSPASVT